MTQPAPVSPAPASPPSPWPALWAWVRSFPLRPQGLAISWGLLVMVLAVFAAGPMMLRYAPYTPSWDDSYFLYSALCTAQAVSGFAWQDFVGCLNGAFKSPIMVFVSVPWGSLGGTEAGIGLAGVGLALGSFALLLLCLNLARRCGIGWGWIAAWLLLCFFNPTLRELGGVLLVDIPFALMVTATLLLLPLELTTARQDRLASMQRGLLWALIASLGVLGKVSYGLFLPIFAFILWQRWRKQGPAGFWPAVGAAAAGSIPALALWAWKGGQYLDHAWRAGVTQAAVYGGPAETVWQYVQLVTQQSGLAVWLLLPVVLGLGWRLWQQRGTDWPRLVPLALMLIYFVLAGSSANQDIRFAFPVMVGLPVALLILLRPSTVPARGLSGLQQGVFALLAMLVSVPAATSPNLEPHRLAVQILDRLHAEGRKDLVIATDQRHLNTSSLMLAQRMDFSRLGPIAIRATVYDELHQVSLEESKQKIRDAGAVFFALPIPNDPDWTNSRAQVLYPWALAAGARPVEKDGPLRGLLLFPDR